MPAAELASIDVDAADVLGGRADELREQVLAEADWPGRFAAVEDFFARHLPALAPGQRGSGSPPAVRDEVSYAWRRLRETHGAVSVADLATEFGFYDQAHMAREFRDLAGCPPSQLLAEELRNVQATSPRDRQ